MPPLGPTKQHDLIRYLRRLGFSGPYSGGKHQFMVRDSLRLRIPNPHTTDIGPHLLRRILRQGDIDVDQWTAL